MISRILHLLVIDILAVGVAMRRGDDSASTLDPGAVEVLDETPDSAPPAAAQRAAPGVSTAGPLARLTSHSR
jgi:glucokinase